MSSKTLSILAIVAALLVVLTAYEASREQTVTFEFQSGQPLVASLDPGKIDTIEMEKGEQRVELKRFDRKSFRIATLNNYPASNRQVNSLISSITDIRCGAETTDDPEGHAALNLAGGEDCTTVRFLDADGNVLSAVMVGAAIDGATHVRLADENQTYRVDGSPPYLRTKSLDYVDKTLVQIPRDQIDQVTVKPAEGKVYTLTMEDGQPKLQSVPEGMKVVDNEPGRVVGAVSYLNFSDLKPLAELEDVGFDATYEVQTDGGARYQFDLGQQGETWWLKGRASYEGPPLNTLKVTRGAEGEEADEEIERNKAYIEASEAVESFLARHQGWAYQVQSYSVESMTRPFDELVEEDDGRPDKITASHILIGYQGASRAGEDVTRTKEEARARAEELLEQVLENPDSFAELAREHSDGPSAEKGGDLGEFDQNTMAPPFTEAAFDLEAGEIASEVVETEFGFHVIKRTK